MGSVGRLYSRYQNYVLSRQKACGDMAGFPSCKDGDPRDVRAGTLAYRLDWCRHLIQHIVYEKLGYVSEEEPRPKIEKGDFIIAARDKRLAGIPKVVIVSGLNNLEGLPTAEAAGVFDPHIERPKPANCGLGEIVEDSFDRQVRKRALEARGSDTADLVDGK